MRGRDWINQILPDELILDIFRHVESKASRDACALVCKRWLRLERISRVTLRIGASGCPDALIKVLARRFVNVRNVFVDERLSISLPVQIVRILILYATISYVYGFAFNATSTIDILTDVYCIPIGNILDFMIWKHCSL